MRIITFILFFLLSFQSALAAPLWVNDLRTLFISNKAVIYALNIRSFNAQDLNGNDIVEPELGEVSGNFINAIARLDELKALGVNTLYVMPITKTGKLKALGTAGSLYAMDSFDTLSPLLDDKTNELSVYDEAKMFVNEAHNRGFRLIVDMPSCGSYDMSLERPDLFIQDKNSQAIVPADWTDVRLFKVYDEKNQLNSDLIDNYKKFVNMALDLGFDGIRADVAAIKPPDFWSEIISYARGRSPQFLFLAEASTAWGNPAKPHTTYASVEKLLDAGFDGYYGDWANFKEISRGKDFIKKIKIDQKISKKFENKKAVMSSFATHDQQSPMKDGNVNYWETLLWLNVTLPINSYFLDGFQTGDSYNFKYENQKALKSYTDDDFYFVHSGKFDIFNLSRRPNGGREDMYEIFKNAMKFKTWSKDILEHGKLTFHRTNSRQVFAYSRDYENDSIIVIVNTDDKYSHQTCVNIGGLTKKSFISPIKINNSPIIKRGKLITQLKPSEVQVYLFSKRQR